MAAHQGHAVIVNQLCRVPRIEVDALDNAGCTPLHHATALGHDGVVMELWSKSANVDLADANGWTGTAISWQHGYSALSYSCVHAAIQNQSKHVSALPKKFESAASQHGCAASQMWTNIQALYLECYLYSAMSYYAAWCLSSLKCLCAFTQDFAIAQATCLMTKSSTWHPSWAGKTSLGPHTYSTYAGMCMVVIIINKPPT